MESALHPGEIENNGYATGRKSLARAAGGRGGINMLHYGLCDNGELCFWFRRHPDKQEHYTCLRFGSKNSIIPQVNQARNMTVGTVV